MTMNNIIRKYTAILALSVVSAAFFLVACAKETAPVEEPIGITMTTKASYVMFYLKGAEDIAIDWGDGKKSNVKDVNFNERLGYAFSHEYSGKTAHNIVITGNVTKLGCSSRQLTALDVSRCTTLTSLICGNNQLTALDLSQNTALTYLDCYDNQLTALDVSRNTALTNFDCRGNQLTALDVSQNMALTVLDLCYNQITKLDLSANNTVLYILCCRNNKFTGSALNDLFKSLRYITPEEPQGGLINVDDTTPGCNFGIAREKGWELTTLHPSDPEKW